MQWNNNQKEKRKNTIGIYYNMEETQKHYIN